MKFADRTLRLTVSKSTKRLFRSGLWSFWHLDIITTFDETDFEWANEIASGWTLVNHMTPFAQFDIGDETEASKIALREHHRIFA